MTAVLLPPPKLQFFALDGSELVGGHLYTYIPGSTSPKPTWQDAAQTVANTNPIVLDERGECIIWGTGTYREILYSVDENNVEVLIWDQVTTDGSDVFLQVDGSNVVMTDQQAAAFRLAIGAASGDNAPLTFPSLVGTGGAQEAVIPVGTTHLSTAGYYEPEDDGGGDYVPSTSGSGPGKFQSADGAWFILATNTPNIRQFGAVCDQSVDDAPAVQAAVNFCALTTAWKPLTFNGLARIASPIIIDRLVDTTTTTFHVYGRGPGAGLYVDSPIFLFDSDIAFTTAPVSETVSFHEMEFVASDPSIAAYVMTDKFLRITFDQCRYYKIKCANSTAAYLQTWYWVNCYAAQFTGDFVFCAEAFDIRWWIDIEAGGAGFICSGSSFMFDMQGAFEGSVGPLAQHSAGRSHNYHDLYLEDNQNQDIVYTTGGQGLSFDNIFISLSTTNSGNPAFFDIALGASTSVSSDGIWCNGSVFDNSSMPQGELVQNAIAAVAVQKVPAATKMLPAGFISGQGNLTAHAGGGMGSAVQVLPGYNRVTTVATVLDSLILPAVVTGYAQFCVVANVSGLTAQIYAPGTGVTINFVNGSTGIPVQSLAVIVFYNDGASTAWNAAGTIPLALNTSSSFGGDSAAATGGVPIGGFYRNGSVVQVRVV